MRLRREKRERRVELLDAAGEVVAVADAAGRLLGGAGVTLSPGEYWVRITEHHVVEEPVDLAVASVLKEIGMFGR